MAQNPGAAKKIEAEMPLSLGRVQLVRESWNEPIEVTATGDAHYLELALFSRPHTGLGCFPDIWWPQRFEPIGQMFLVPAKFRFHAKSDCRLLRSIVCIFEPAAVTAWFDRDMQWTSGRLQGSLNIVNPKIRSLLMRIGEELRTPGFAGEMMVELLAAQAAIEVSRHLSGIDEERTAGGLSPSRLKLVDERLSDIAAPPPSLAELAGLCNISVRHLTRGFRISRGQSIGKYVAERGMENAKRLLASGMNVKSVAHAAGFSAPSNFATAFLRATGETPRQYRQKAGIAGYRAQAFRPTSH